MTDEKKEPEKDEPDTFTEGYVPEDYINPDPVLESLRRLRAAS